MPSASARPRRHPARAWVGTLLVMLVTMFTALPLGVAAGIYLEEYAPQELAHRAHRDQHRQPRRRAVDHLGPDGAWAVRLHASASARSILTAGLTLGLLVLPIVIIATREAIRAIPRHDPRGLDTRCGATKWQTVRYHVLPYSMGGILTGSIIGLSRAIGETAPLITIGALTLHRVPARVARAGRTPYVTFDWLNRAFTVCRSRCSTGSRGRTARSTRTPPRRASC